MHSNSKDGIMNIRDVSIGTKFELILYDINGKEKNQYILANLKIFLSRGKFLLPLQYMGES